MSRVLTARVKPLANGRHRVICGVETCPVELGTTLVASVSRPDGSPASVVTLERRGGYWRDAEGVYHLIKARYARDGAQIGRRPLPRPLASFASRPGARGVHGATPVLSQGRPVIIECSCGRLNRVELPGD